MKTFPGSLSVCLTLRPRPSLVSYLLFLFYFGGSTDALSWVWRQGTSVPNQQPFHGTLGETTPINNPGSRSETAFVTSNNTIFLFGGKSQSGIYSDTWVNGEGHRAWTWISGPTTRHRPAILISESGMYLKSNNPGARSLATITAIGSIVYLFGGKGHVNGTIGAFNDVWGFNTTTHSWAHLVGDPGGHIFRGPNAAHGILGVFNSTNTPGARFSMRWVAVGFNLYLFGGEATTRVFWNDLWVFDTNLRLWAWISGPTVPNAMAPYPALRISSSEFAPFPRSNFAMGASFDSIFVFGGEYMNIFLNDVVMFKIDSRKWSWVSGLSSPNKVGRATQKRVPATTNYPASRTAMGFISSGYELLVYGGTGVTQRGPGSLRDLWIFSYQNLAWAWLDGDSTTKNVPGNYRPSISNRFPYPGGRIHTQIFLQGGITYLFGGYGYGIGGSPGYLNDLWLFGGSGSCVFGLGQGRCTGSCAKGGFITQFSCAYCPAGSFSNTSQQKTCYECDYNPGYGTSGLGETQCTICESGKYGTGRTCIDCESGTFSKISGETLCDQCPLGHVSQPGAKECTPCTPGKYSFENECHHCARGTYNELQAQSSCKQCPYGKLATKSGQACETCSIGQYVSNLYCENCPRGTFSNQPKASHCDQCVGGRFTASTRQTLCAECTPGTFSFNGATYCKNCSVMTYNDVPGASTCMKCSTNTFSEVVGSTTCDICGPGDSNRDAYGKGDFRSRKECYCSAGFYGSPYNGDPCFPCKQGTICYKNTTIPQVIPGYLRGVDTDPSVVYACNPPDSCALTTCAYGYSGEICGECAVGSHYRVHNKCVACNWYQKLIYFLMLFFAFPGLYLILYLSTPVLKKSHAVMVSIHWFQILNIVSQAGEEWPGVVNWMSTFSSLMNFNIEVLAPECSFEANYWTKWFVKMTTPLLFGAVTLSVFVLQEYFIQKYYIYNFSVWEFCKTVLNFCLNCIEWIGKACEDPEGEKEKAKNRLKQEDKNGEISRASETKKETEKEVELKEKIELCEAYPFRFSRYVYAFAHISLGLYVLMASTLLETLLCRVQPNGDYLMEFNNNQRCYDAYWYQILFTNIVFSLLHFVLFPLYVYKVTKEAVQAEESERVRYEKNFGLLILPYKKEVFWWPVAEMVFRFLLVVSVKGIGYVSFVTGMCLALVLILLYDIVLWKFQPFIKRINMKLSFLYVFNLLKKHYQALICRWSVFLVVSIVFSSVYGVVPAVVNSVFSVVMVVCFVVVVAFAVLSVRMELL